MPSVDFYLPWMFIHILCTLFYVYILVVVHRNRRLPELRSTYFTLWRYLGVADISMAVFGWLTFKIGYGLKSMPLFVGDFYAGLATPEGYAVRLAITYYLGSTEMLGVMMLTLNRFTSIIHPMSHEAIWLTGNRMKYALWLQFGASLIYPCIAVFGYFKYRTVNGIQFKIRDLLSIVSIFTGIAYLIVYAAFNIAILYRLVVNRSHQHDSSDTHATAMTRKQKAAEVRLTLNTLFLSGLGFVFMLVLAIPMLDVDPQLYYQLWFHTGDIYAWSNPFLICLTSETVRSIALRGGKVRPTTPTGMMMAR